jgi:hypothetical protein
MSEGKANGKQDRLDSLVTAVWAKKKKSGEKV